MNRIVFSLTAIAMFALNYVRAESVYLEDFSFSVEDSFGGEVLSARWGVWTGLEFIQAVESVNHVGYYDVAASELIVSLNQTDNSTYSQGTQFALAIFGDGASADSQNINWGAASNAVILVDTNWVAPTFGNNVNQVTFNFSSQTTAVLGSYSFNAGNEIIGLAAVGAIPEPSSFALLFGAAAIGMVGCRRRQRA